MSDSKTLLECKMSILQGAYPGAFTLASGCAKHITRAPHIPNEH
ncbi:hypothetical protein ACSAZK_01915 [Methanosarcina sp. Mfa9]